MSEASTPRRIGFFGGSFDPIHFGHLILAESCRESLSLDRVVFKTASKPASNRDRIELVRLAIGGHPAFHIDTREIDRGGVSYTIDSVKSLKTDFPASDVFLLLGADSLVDIAKWREPAELFKLAMPAVIQRGGFAPIDWSTLEPYMDRDRLKQCQSHRIESPLIEISSSDIRSRIAAGRSIKYLVPPAVEAYIREAELFR
jgi:nicotinate-nucleotide adenylyltransferase